MTQNKVKNQNTYKKSPMLYCNSQNKFKYKNE